MEVMQSTVQINYNLEIRKQTDHSYTVRLINLINKYCYVPAVKGEFGANEAESVNKSGFEIKDIFEIESPIIIINGIEFKFKRQFSRFELESMLSQQGTRNSDIIYVKSELEQLKLSTTNKLDELDTIISFNSHLLEKVPEEKDSNIKALNDRLKSVKENMKPRENDKSDNSDYELSDLDKKYQNISGKIRYCLGSKCLEIGNIWGNNPYAIVEGEQVNYCVAARHSGIVGSMGGFFEVKLIGFLNSYEDSVKNEICSLPSLSNSGFSIHPIFNKSLIEGKSQDSCTEL